MTTQVHEDTVVALALLNVLTGIFRCNHYWVITTEHDSLYHLVRSISLFLNRETFLLVCACELSCYHNHLNKHIQKSPQLRTHNNLAKVLAMCSGSVHLLPKACVELWSREQRVQRAILSSLGMLFLCPVILFALSRVMLGNLCFAWLLLRTTTCMPPDSVMCPPALMDS